MVFELSMVKTEGHGIFHEVAFFGHAGKLDYVQTPCISSGTLRSHA